MVPTTRGRALYAVLCATLLTAAVVGLERRDLAGRSPAAGEGTLLVSSPPSSPSATRSAPRPTAPPERPRSSVSPVTTGAQGVLAVVPGEGAVRGTGRLRRYRVMVETGLPESAAGFAADVERTLADPRAWGADGRASFQRVATGSVDFTVVLATPSTADRLCRPLDTSAIYSCFSGGRSVVNEMRWRNGAPAYAGDLASYRQYVVLHEVGHALGHRHESCPGPGRLAPTMMQQTKGVGACRANPWPYPAED